MKLSPKRLSRCAAITCIGLAGSAFAAFAQAPGPAKPGPVAPPAFTCATGEVAFRNGNGTNDNFAGTADPAPHPTSQFAAAPGLQLNAATNKYDQTASNYHFGDSFTLNQSAPITKLRVTMNVKSNSPDSSNDGMSLSTQPGYTPGHFSWGFAQGLGPIGWGLLTFDFDRNLNQVKVNNAVLTPPGYLAVNFFMDLDNGRALHVFMQDDTSVDYIQIEGCYKPAPKYDLTASKKREGSAFILNVHNNGSQIMPTGKVDVVEVIPAGLTITSFPASPWTCTGSLPVVGPDSFTCSYQIPSGGIATGANLPQIVLKSEGKAECPNCMRVKLYLKDFAEGGKPVNEGDMKNNVSCVN